MQTFWQEGLLNGNGSASWKHSSHGTTVLSHQKLVSLRSSLNYISSLLHSLAYAIPIRWRLLLPPQTPLLLMYQNYKCVTVTPYQLKAGFVSSLYKHKNTLPYKILGLKLYSYFLKILEWATHLTSYSSFLWVFAWNLCFDTTLQYFNILKEILTRFFQAL